MDIDRAEMIALDLMRYYVPDFSFSWDRSFVRFGFCHRLKKRITISKRLTELNSEEIFINTILHEIAHAISPAFSHHDEEWRKNAVSIGCDGQRCYGDDVVQVKPLYRITCQKCGYQILRGRYRRFRVNHLMHRNCGGFFQWNKIEN